MIFEAVIIFLKTLKFNAKLTLTLSKYFEIFVQAVMTFVLQLLV